MSIENETTKLSGGASVGSKEVLDAAFQKYVDADTDERLLRRKILAESIAYQSAKSDTEKAWREYVNAKIKHEASNPHIAQIEQMPK